MTRRGFFAATAAAALGIPAMKAAKPDDDLVYYEWPQCRPCTKAEWESAMAAPAYRGQWTVKSPSDILKDIDSMLLEMFA